MESTNNNNAMGKNSQNGVDPIKVNPENVETIGKDALAVPYDDCESGDYTISLTQNNIVFEFNCDAIVDVTGSLVYLKEHVFDNMDIKPKVIRSMTKIYEE